MKCRTPLRYLSVVDQHRVVIKMSWPDGECLVVVNTNGGLGLAMDRTVDECITFKLRMICLL